MGLSIHYSGRFNPKKELTELIIEVKEVAEAFNWKYHIFNQSFPDKEVAFESHEFDGDIYGIWFTPPECEAVSLCFLSNGQITNPAKVALFGHSDDPEDRKFILGSSTKTQYAGMAVHKIIIKFFRHLEKQQYFIDFDMMDESLYWETDDEVLMEDKFKEYDALIDNFTSAIAKIDKKQEESIEEYFDRIIKRIKKK